MGMDVYGKNAKTEEGKYFRNNVWWWRPLAKYAMLIAPTVCVKCKYWHTNDGEGLNDADSQVLAGLLTAEVSSGRCASYAKEYEAARAALPKETCELCHGTGSRTDAIGKQHGMDKTGGCNGCGGKGEKQNWDAAYPFSEENVKSLSCFSTTAQDSKLTENYTNWYNSYMKSLADLPLLLTRLRPSQEYLREGLQERLAAVQPLMQALTHDEFEKTVMRPPEGSTLRLYKKVSEDIREAADQRVEIADCKEGVLYRVLCRNSNCGIWIPKEKGFRIARTKFDDSYLFVEYHWDNGAPFGTARPYEVLQKLPVFKDDTERLEYLLLWREKLGSY